MIYLLQLIHNDPLKLSEEIYEEHKTFAILTVRLTDPVSGWRLSLSGRWRMMLEAEGDLLHELGAILNAQGELPATTAFCH